MSFIVSARKYRPNRFEDVVGQEHISQTLKNALKSDHVAHAFLFCGPRGVGKTTCARILAKILNCENRTSDYEACNECHSCTSFNENASFNIVELDAASNNSVEHIRALIEQVRFQPQHGKYKVFIIDEVHMLSTQAFNAFLKTLEEPPPYAIFILATTEKHKIIPTILSRCQIYDFRRIQASAAVGHLKNICEKEGITAEEDALHTISVKADGAMRDALSIFDRIVSAAGNNITYKDVVDNLNILDYDYYFRVVDALLTENMPQIMLLFDEILRKGFDMEVFINGLGEHLRNLLVCKDEQMLKLLDVGETQRARYKKQAQISPTSFLLTALNLCNDCDVRYKQAQNKRLHVEMSLIKMTYINRAVDLSKMPQQGIEAEKKNLDAYGSVTTADKQAVPLANAKPVALNPEALAPNNQGMLDVKKEDSLKPSQIVAEPKPPLLKASILSGGILKGLTNVYEVVKEEHQRDLLSESLLNEDNLKTAWAKFIEQIESPSLKNSLGNATQIIEDKRIIIKVASKLAQDNIRQTLDLIDFLRKELNDRELMLDIRLDQEKMAELAAAATPQRPMTVKEKYEKMVEMNPLVDVLRQTFELKLSND
jgi:DNA polymerase III subunit gamma/tau